jgi:hypothetical protein
MLAILESQSLSSPRSFSLRGPVLLAAAAILNLALVSSFAQAVPINYGSFSGATVNYTGVSEDTNSGDTLPLFGEPVTIGPVTPGYPAVPCVNCAIPGNSLNFDPTGFGASASGAGGNDITDGNLTFTVIAKQGHGITSVSLAEAGDLTLAGTGTDNTSVGVSANGVLNIVAVDGVGITPIVVPISMSMSPSGGTFGLVSDGGASAPFPYFANWSGSWVQPLSAILAANGFGPNQLATQLSINIDNTLTATSEAGTIALIAKKDFGGLSITATTIPEPATWVLLAICGLLGAAYRKR